MRQLFPCDSNYPSNVRRPALLIVPPFVRSSSGPALGPAMLAGAATRAGYRVEVLDLAIDLVRNLVSANELRVATGLAGDHDKNERSLRDAQYAFFHPMASRSSLAVDQLRSCRLSWAELDNAVDALSNTSWACTVAERLARIACPLLIGVSVMFADQLLAALVVSRITRRMWPTAPVIWGGAHVTALSPEIAADVRYGADVAGFVAGYAEQTFVELLDAVERGQAWPTAVFQAGTRRFPRAVGALATVPAFSGLDSYGAPRLTLPAQITRGCAYGKCAFCTYPFVEGGVVKPHTLDHIEAVVMLAAERDAIVSFKDSLMTSPYLRRAAAIVRGRTGWSACTKLAPGLIELLPTLAESGCQTLEVGLETIVETSQLVILKPVTRSLVERCLCAAQQAGVRIVVNYMTGLPGESPIDAAAGLEWIRSLAESTSAVVEHHIFELERRAPLARSLRVTDEWPWASVLEWDASARAVA